MCVTEVRTVRIGYQKRRAIIYVDMTIISTRVNAAISKKYHSNGWNRILNNQINNELNLTNLFFKVLQTKFTIVDLNKQFYIQVASWSMLERVDLNTYSSHSE